MNRKAGIWGVLEAVQCANIGEKSCTFFPGFHSMCDPIWPPELGTEHRALSSGTQELAAIHPAAYTPRLTSFVMAETGTHMRVHRQMRAFVLGEISIVLEFYGICDKKSKEFIQP